MRLVAIDTLCCESTDGRRQTTGCGVSTTIHANSQSSRIGQQSVEGDVEEDIVEQSGARDQTGDHRGEEQDAKVGCAAFRIDLSPI